MTVDRESYEFTEPGLWPTARQELLLRAALHDGDAARDAWRQWSACIDMEEEFDRGSFRLLPLLYQNMLRLQVTDRLMLRLKGVYRMAWVETNRLFHEMVPLLAKLQKQGIRTLLLKGAPLALVYYRSASVRPMADLDILVQAADAKKAMDFLESENWNRHETVREESFSYRHSMQYSNSDGFEFDLHWHVLYECSYSGADTAFWNNSVEFDFQGVNTLRLSTTHTFLHTIIHGVRWNPEPPIRWIADAMTVLQSEDVFIDWDFILDFARKNKLSHRISLGTLYLRDRMGASIPDQFLNDLLAIKTTWLEKIENTCVLHNERHLQSLMGNQWLIFVEYCRYANYLPRKDRLPGFLHYLRYRWRLGGRREIPKVIVKGLAQRVKRLFTCVNVNSIVNK